VAVKGLAEQLVSPDFSVGGIAVSTTPSTIFKDANTTITQTDFFAPNLGNLHFERSDITQDPIGEAFDVIHVRFLLTHPAGLAGEVKLVTPITMENIADAVVEAALATRAEVDQTVDELYAFARAPDTLLSCPRIVQTWGRRLAAI